MKPDIRTVTTCPKCGESLVIKLPLDADMFLALSKAFLRQHNRHCDQVLFMGEQPKQKRKSKHEGRPYAAR